MLFFFGEDQHDVPEALSPLLCKLKQLQTPLSRLAKACLFTNQIQAVLKTEGLSEASGGAVRALLAQLSIHCPIKTRLTAWLDSHLKLLSTLQAAHPSLTRLPVSSDVIESLFGRFKHVLSRHPRPELGQLTVMLATLCGRHSPATITEALAHTRTRELEVLRGNHLPHSIEIKRREFRQKTEAASRSDKKKSGTARMAG